MDKLMCSDVYQVRASYPYSTNSQRVVVLMYQPIIGCDAVSVYNFLWVQQDEHSLTSLPTLFSVLTKLTGLSIEQVDDSLSKLEGIGLMRRYIKKDDPHRSLLELKNPLTPHRFVKHQILNTLLYRIVGKDEYLKILNYFRTYDVDKNKYVDMTKRFRDVFDINLTKNGPTLKMLDYQDKDYGILESEYPLDLFYDSLDSVQLSKKMFKENDENIIKQLGYLYRIDALTMQDLVKESMDNDVLNHKALTTNCRNYFSTMTPESFSGIYHKQSIAKTSNGGKGSFDKHVKYLETTNPYDVIKDKQGGKEPLKRDLQIVEGILTSLDLEPGVMNVLIELTLSQCDNTLPRAFMETRASQWKRKNIETVEQAIDEAKEYIKQRRNIKINISSDEYLMKVDEDKDVDSEKLSDILSDFE